MLQTIELKLYIVQNSEGNFFRAKGLLGYGDSWVKDVNKARVYSKIGPARSICTYWTNISKGKYHSPVILELSSFNVKVLDEKERINKSIKFKKEKELQREVFYKKQEVKELEKKLQEYELKLKKLKEKEYNIL